MHKIIHDDDDGNTVKVKGYFDTKARISQLANISTFPHKSFQIN